MTNLVLKRTVALLNIPSIRDTYNELGVFEMRSEHLADVLCVGQIQSGVYFIEDIQRSWFKQQHRKDKRQSDQRLGKKNRVK